MTTARTLLLAWSVAHLGAASSACGSEAPPSPAIAPLSPTAQADVLPTTGGRAASPAGPASAVPPATPFATALSQSAAETHRARVEALVGGELAAADLRRLLFAPIHELELTLDDVAMTYRGTARISLHNATAAAWPRLTFALPPNTMHPAAAPRDRLVTVGSVRVGGKDVRVQGSASLLHVPVAVGAGESIEVAITFAGSIPALARPDWGKAADDPAALFEMLGGGGHYGFGAFGHRDGIVNLARFYPMWVPPDVAARLGPQASADDVGYFEAGHVQLVVRAAPELTIISGGVERARTLVGTQRETRLVAPGVRELAINASRRLVSRSADAGPVKVTSWFLPHHVKTGRDVLSWARRAVEVYQDLYGPYPWPELTLVESPLAGSAGGVAFGGIVEISDIFYPDPREGDAGRKPLLEVLSRHPQLRETLEFVVAHEVAHQWWGVVVASDRVTSAYVDEGLASTAALAYLEAAHDKKVARRQKELQLKVMYQLSRQLGGADHPVGTSPRRFESIVEYSGIVYGKAGMYFDTLRRAMSRAYFDKALRKLRDEHAFSVVSPEGVRDTLVAMAPRPDEARRITQRWLEGSHGDEDIGQLRPDVLFEYLVSDAAVDGGARELVGLLAGNEQFKELLTELMEMSTAAGGLDASRIAALMGRVIGDEHPEVKRWLDLAAKVGSGRPSEWGPALLGELMGELGAELGVSEEDQKLINGAAALLLQALDDDAPPQPQPQSQPQPQPQQPTKP